MQLSIMRAMQPSNISSTLSEQCSSVPGHAVQPFWSTVALSPAFLGNVTQGWMGRVRPALVGNAASFHVSNAANPYRRDAA